MINELSARIKPKNKNGVVLFLSSLTLGTFLFVFSTALESYRGVVGLFALAFIVYALYVFTKYVSREYCYDITTYDEPMLVVRQLVGNRSTTMCRVSLSDISEIILETREMRAAHKTPQGYLKYNYTLTLGNIETVRAVVKSRYEKCEIVLEGTAELAELLDAYVNEAKRLKSEQDDE